MSLKFCLFLSIKSALTYKNKNTNKCNLVYKKNVFMYGDIMSIKMSLSTIRVHCRVVCSVVVICPPGHSQVHRPRGPPSPTATSADSASDFPALRCRTGLLPGSSFQVGRLCVDEAFIQI